MTLTRMSGPVGQHRPMRLLDGNGWVRCEGGHLHWGRYGAAGLLLLHQGDDGTRQLLLQHRALWSHHGGTWGLPGGARNHGETAEETALRETREEVHADLGPISVVRTHVDDHGGWSYETVIAHASSLIDVAPRGGESVDVRWVPEHDLTHYELHPNLAITLPKLLTA